MEKLTGFAKIKWEVGQIQFNHLSMSDDKKYIEANPATHRIAEYIQLKYVPNETAEAKDKEIERLMELLIKAKELISDATPYSSYESAWRKRAKEFICEALNPKEVNNETGNQ